MGQSLRLDITAEGVETDRQRVMLRNKGCTFIQGFLLAKPCQADQLDLSPRVRYLHTVGSGSALPRLTAVPAIAQSV
jgi:predicted signal transduction protein with EAL and GGDEF domain